MYVGYYRSGKVEHKGLHLHYPALWVVQNPSPPGTSDSPSEKCSGWATDIVMEAFTNIILCWGFVFQTDYFKFSFTEILMMCFKGLHDSVYLKSGFEKNKKENRIVVAGGVAYHPEPLSGVKACSLSCWVCSQHPAHSYQPVIFRIASVKKSYLTQIHVPFTWRYKGSAFLSWFLKMVKGHSWLRAPRMIG